MRKAASWAADFAGETQKRWLPGLSPALPAGILNRRPQLFRSCL